MLVTAVQSLSEERKVFAWASASLPFSKAPFVPFPLLANYPVATGPSFFCECSLLFPFVNWLLPGDTTSPHSRPVAAVQHSLPPPRSPSPACSLCKLSVPWAPCPAPTCLLLCLLLGAQSCSAQQPLTGTMAPESPPWHCTSKTKSQEPLPCPPPLHEAQAHDPLLPAALQAWQA